MKILFKFATRGRPERMAFALQSIYDNLTSEDYHIWMTIDDNDHTMGNISFDNYKNLSVGWGISEDKIDAINRDMHFATATFDWDILINMSDDMEFQVKGFDSIIRDDMKEDCFLHYPDGNHRTLCTMSIMDRAYYERTGYIYHPDYENVWCDNEATLVAVMLGKYKFVDKQIFSHNHAAWGKAPMDERYKITESTYYQDELVFKHRREKNFDLPKDFKVPVNYPNTLQPV